jgi:23S rRNA (uridine2552-2'-O)-methyltransferase
MDQARSEALFERALEIAEQTLSPGGNFVGKIFQGPEFKRLIDRVRAGFAVGKAAKPDSSRKISIEQFVVGAGFRSATRAPTAMMQSASGALGRGAATPSPVRSELPRSHPVVSPVVASVATALPAKAKAAPKVKPATSAKPVKPSKPAAKPKAKVAKPTAAKSKKKARS